MGTESILVILIVGLVPAGSPASSYAAAAWAFWATCWSASSAP